MNLPVYFISDIHLMLTSSTFEENKLKILFDFFKHIEKTGGVLFIVGDLFDFYFEYPHLIPKAYFRFYSKLFDLKQSGVEIHYILGNHDYWILDFMTETLTTKSYKDDVQLKLKEKSFYITHGDGLLPWDRGYRILKSIIRNPVFIWLFRWLHPTIAYRFASWVANRSRHYEHSPDYNKRVLDELSEVAEQYIASGTDYFLSGHYHQASEQIIKNGKLIILGDWIQYNSYGYFDGNDLTLKFWNVN
ncbi:UDP-2,3-diacylglucosamine diphosphatase [Candidatus Neomarinimicrobiota bacterium]